MSQVIYCTASSPKDKCIMEQSLFAVDGDANQSISTTCCITSSRKTSTNSRSDIRFLGNKAKHLWSGM